MKKYLVSSLCFIVLFSIVVSISASSVLAMSDTKTHEIHQEEDEWVTANRVIPDEIPRFDGRVNIKTPKEAEKDIPLWFDGSPEYRAVYYFGTTFLADYVDQDKLTEWSRKFYAPDYNNGRKPEEMYLVSLVKYCHVPREVFDEALERYAEKINDYAAKHGEETLRDEGHELPNADIIYTFDNEIINNYYLRDQG